MPGCSQPAAEFGHVTSAALVTTIELGSTFSRVARSAVAASTAGCNATGTLPATAETGVNDGGDVSVGPLLGGVEVTDSSVVGVVPDVVADPTLSEPHAASAARQATRASTPERRTTSSTYARP